MAKDSPEETLRKRTAELAQLYFTSDESDEIARLLIRKLDHVKAYHCDTAGCGQECVFSRETCPHTGCGMVYSRKWAYQHDLACPHKMVACERACGETVKRLRMGEHMREDCGLRTVRCALYDFGCTTEILAKDMAAHTQNAQEAHLCIVISRMKEVQDVVVGQQRRIAELEEVASRVPKLEASVSTHGRSITALTAGVAAGAVALKASEVRSTKLIGDKVNAVGEQVLENKRDITRIKVLVFPH
ncbi:hypothetical protein B484DRAFT_330497 [Ochromonadaceae sp. CCMP2298]|nr:hypothetical protein B484DRAFT_330497 [Ochromonadaceae sp. CCMP2298]